MLSDQVPSTSSISSTTNSTTTVPISSTSTPTNSKTNDDPNTFSVEETRYFQSVMIVMKWNEQKSNELLQLTRMNGSNLTNNRPANQQEFNFIAHYFANDSNGNPFPYSDFINSLNIPQSLYRT